MNAAEVKRKALRIVKEEAQTGAGWRAVYDRIEREIVVPPTNPCQDCGSGELAGDDERHGNYETCIWYLAQRVKALESRGR